MTIIFILKPPTDKPPNLALVLSTLVRVVHVIHVLHVFDSLVRARDRRRRRRHDRHDTRHDGWPRANIPTTHLVADLGSSPDLVALLCCVAALDENKHCVGWEIPPRARSRAWVRGCNGCTMVFSHYAGSLSLTLTRDILYSPSPLYVPPSIVFYDGRFPLHVLRPCKSR